MISLEKMGETAEAALRRALNGTVSLERRQRLEKLLQKLESSSERLRIPRMLEMLEQINTPEALQVIRRMAQGAPESFRTQQAKTVVDRRRPR
jgi:glutaredoxin 2